MPLFPVVPRVPHILLFGDSLTERGTHGWGSRLALLYARRADVVIRGFGGYNTRNALDAAPAILAPYAAQGAPELALAVVWFGANDSALPEAERGTPHSARQHVPAAEFAENLRRLVGIVRAAQPGARILLLSPPPVHEPTRLAQLLLRAGEREFRSLPEGSLDRRNAATRVYSEACIRVAKEEGAAVLDLWTELQRDPLGREIPPDVWGPKFLDDGLHFTPQGEERVGQLVKACVLGTWPEMEPLKMGRLFPHWEDVVGMQGWGKDMMPS
ncbi:SGNH hydrolase-type esterase domain-containing protein [Hyaloraphidium curvatum]|nr:SGNH hydrolase-type esterase domain-containing protein [Hyaloraphidium curvatum]